MEKRGEGKRYLGQMKDEGVFIYSNVVSFGT